MSWFPSSNIANIAKNALKEAQKTFDNALDIKDKSDESGKTFNTTVASVADAATDFLNSWGMSVVNKTSPNKSIDKRDLESPVSTTVVTTAPTATLATKSVLDKSPSTSSLSIPNGNILEVTSTSMKRSLTTVDVSCELVAPVSHQNELEEAQNNSESESDGKFQSLWVFDGSDSFSSSIETSSTSTIEVLDESNHTEDVEVAIIRHPKPIHVQPKSVPLTILATEQQTQLITSALIPTSLIPAAMDSIPSTESKDAEFSLQNNLETTDFHIVSLEPTLEEDNQKSLSHEQIVTEHEGDLDSSTATTVEPEQETEIDEATQLTLTSSLLDENPILPETDGLDCEVEVDPISSKVSISSRATSSISVISEEKDSSSPQISPTSQRNLTESRDSPSFEVISIPHHQGPRKNDPNSNYDFLASSSSQHHHICPSQTSSVSVITSLQSTPDRGTPLTHSRSNSNTSSSFDRIEEFNRTKCPAHQFMSSTSSSDIEVIPLDSVSVESFQLLHRKRKSVVEMETQTLIPWPEIIEPKEKVVEMIPAKISAKLAEKDSEILELREEGEKLSKKQFELGNAIKKLRQKEKDMDTTVKSLKNDLTIKNIEIEKLSSTLIAKESQDLAQSEVISKLNTENRKHQILIEKLRSELEDAKENTASMKASVEDASVEILELQNVISTVQRDTAGLDNLTRQNGELTSRSESLQKEVEQLRKSINSSQLKTSSRESELKTQIHTLTQKIHILENQLADNSSEIADATMPLSLEIEKLQQELKFKARRFEKRELSLENKILELESKLKSQGECEKNFKSSQSILQNLVNTLEQTNEKLEDEKLILISQLSVEKDLRKEHLEKLSEFSSLQVTIQDLTSEILVLRNENESIKTELKTEGNLLQIETKRNQVLSEQLKLNTTNQPMERVSYSSTKLEESRNTSPRSLISEASYLDDVLDPNGQNPCLTPKSFFDSFSSVNYIENLQGHLRQRELELNQLHEEVSKNEKIRKTLNEEIAHLTVNNQELLQRIEKQVGLQHKLIDVEKNYNAVLQMYGEKVEEADELRMDIQDVKEMYKVQIEQLLRKS